MKKLIVILILGLFLTAPVNAQDAAPASATATPEASGTRIDTLDIRNMDILDVLKLISQKTGMNIIAGHEVTGRVSVYLKDIEAEKALKIIVESYNWAFKKEDDLIKVMTAKDFEDRYGYRFGENIVTRIDTLNFARAEELIKLLNELKSPSGKVIVDNKSNTLIMKDTPSNIEEMRTIIQRIDVPTETKVFELTYSPAEDIAAKLGEAGTPIIGKVKFDERTNTLIISDTPIKIAEMAKMIEAFDRKNRIVQIDARILSITLSDEYKWGVNWQAMVQEYHELDLKGNFDILGANDRKGTLRVGTLEEDNYTAMVEALETIGETNILSNPSITTINNKEAKILVGSEEPYVTSTTTTTASGPSTTAESVNFIEVGVRLFVTPTIHNDDFITIKVKPEVSSVVRTITTGNNNVIPVVETSEAETTVTVKDGVMIVIGGLIKEEDIEEAKGIPFLGRVPVVGAFFRNKSDLARKTEIVIFLRPKIVTGDIDIAKRGTDEDIL